MTSLALLSTNKAYLQDPTAFLAKHFLSADGHLGGEWTVLKNAGAPAETPSVLIQPSLCNVSRSHQLSNSLLKLCLNLKKKNSGQENWILALGGGEELWEFSGFSLILSVWEASNVSQNKTLQGSLWKFTAELINDNREAKVKCLGSCPFFRESIALGEIMQYIRRN